MKANLVFALLFFSRCLIGHSQSTLYFEAFDNGVMTFDLNSADMGSVGTAGANKFVINDNYAGGSGTTTCIFPVSFNVPATASQPAGISGSPASNYLHTLSNIAENASIYNCCFLAADGICSNAENYFSKMNTDISTIGYTGVSLAFWWICQGGNNSYGEVYYSLDGGNSWNLLGSPVAQYRNQSNWAQVTVSNALFDNQAALRFGFRFVNQLAGLSIASDPGFGIDDIRITGTLPAQPALSTGTATGNPWCPGENITVEFTATGAFNPGNVFTAEMSDLSGSFANPVVIGSLAGDTSGIINAAIPSSVQIGTGYRFRVVSSNPALVADDNGADMTVASAPVASLGILENVCLHDAPFPMYGGLPAGGSYIGAGITSNIFDPQAAGMGTFQIIYTFTDLTSCSDTGFSKITVNPVPEASFSGLNPEYCSNDSPVNLAGSPPGGTFSGSGISGNVFDPSASGTGPVDVIYVYINQQNCADTFSQITAVNLCDGILNQNAGIFFSIYPLGSEVVVEFSSLENQNIEIETLNLWGQTLWAEKYQISNGLYNFRIARFPGGVNLIRLKTAQGEFVKKIAAAGLR